MMGTRQHRQYTLQFMDISSNIWCKPLVTPRDAYPLNSMGWTKKTAPAPAPTKMLLYKLVDTCTLHYNL